MWNDGSDKIDEVFDNLVRIPQFPTRCPVCDKNEMHIYMQVHSYKNRRGGLWIWCSHCGIFSHSSLRVPEYWENCDCIEMEKLCAVPEYLDRIKDALDRHANAMIKKRILSQDKQGKGTEDNGNQETLYTDLL